jgi:hypothetical protein
MFGLGIADAPRRVISASTEQRRPFLAVMGIGGQNMDAPLVQHPLCPILRSFAERASDGAGSDLHPHSTLRQPLDRVIAPRNPG